MGSQLTMTMRHYMSEYGDVLLDMRSCVVIFGRIRLKYRLSNFFKSTMVTYGDVWSRVPYGTRWCNMV